MAAVTYLFGFSFFFLFYVLSISHAAFTYYTKEWLFRGKKQQQKLMILLAATLGASRQTNHALTNFVLRF